MEYVISAVWSGLELFCAILFNGAFLASKTRKKHDVLFIVGIWVLITTYSNYPILPLFRQLGVPLFYAGISVLLEVYPLSRTI